MRIDFDNEQHCQDLIRLNERWIRQYFALEQADHDLARDPLRILREGGHLISLVQDEMVVGICALLNEGQGRYQLARMAVEPSQQGKGYGDALIRAALERAAADGGKWVYLLSNTSLQAAIGLYRKHGFETLQEGPHPLYARCNIIMQRPLPGYSAAAQEEGPW